MIALFWIADFSPIGSPVFIFIIFIFLFIFISWRLITLQYCSGFCHTLTWINGFTCIPHPEPPSHVPFYPMITLYAKQKRRHRCTEQTFGLCGRRRGWDLSREQHRNMYIIYSETDHQTRLDAWDKCSGLVHWVVLHLKEFLSDSAHVSPICSEVQQS